MMDPTRKSALALLGAAIPLLAVGCLSLDPAPVEEARIGVEAARTDPNVAETSLDLEEAQRHLALAESALDRGRFQKDVDHEAFMASSYALVAVVQGEAQSARQETAAVLARAAENSDATREQIEYAVARARALDALQTERGIVLTLGGVNFGFDSAELKSGAKLAVARVAGFLIAADDREILVEGFTDDQGKEDYNLGLSLRRAEAVAAALTDNGVSPARIAADGFGSAFPVASNEADEGRAENRRVEIIILEPGRFAVRERRSSPLPGVAAGAE